MVAPICISVPLLW